MNHSTTTKCCNKHFPLLLTIFNNRPTAFCHCPLPPVTVHRLLSLPMPTCYWPAAFYHCVPTPSCKCPSLPITVYLILSLPTAPYHCPTLLIAVHLSLQLPLLTFHSGILLHQAERSIRITTVSVRTELTVVIPMITAGCMVIPDANHLIVSTLRICTVVQADILLHQAERSLRITTVSVRTELTVVIRMNTCLLYTSPSPRD